MSTEYIRLHYGPIKTLDGIVHMPQKIRGLQDYLRIYGFRVDTIPVHVFEYCVIELCGCNIFQCKVSNLRFNTHWSRDVLCQTAIKAVILARDNFRRVCVYLWLRSMIEDTILRRSQFVPKDYCVDNISDMYNKYSTINTTESNHSLQHGNDTKDENILSPLQYIRSERISISREMSFNDICENAKKSVFSNLLSQRIRTASQKVQDNRSLLKLNSDSTFFTCQQASPTPTSHHDLNSSFFEQTFTKKLNVTENNNVITTDSKDSKTLSREKERLETTEPIRHSEGDVHFLAVHSALSVARNELSNVDLTECPSQVFMQHFIASSVQLNKSTLDIDNNNSKGNSGQESTTSSIIEDNIILEIPKKFAFNSNKIEFLKESDEGNVIASANSKISI